VIRTALWDDMAGQPMKMVGLSMALQSRAILGAGYKKGDGHGDHLPLLGDAPFYTYTVRWRNYYSRSIAHILLTFCAWADINKSKTSQFDCKII
jgi:hypothetical protein